VHGLQQRSKEFVQTLKNMHAAIAHVQQWTMQYKGAPLHLAKKMKPQAELEKAKVQMMIQNYEQIAHSSATYRPYMHGFTTVCMSW